MRRFAAPPCVTHFYARRRCHADSKPPRAAELREFEILTASAEAHTYQLLKTMNFFKYPSSVMRILLLHVIRADCRQKRYELLLAASIISKQHAS